MSDLRLELRLKNNLLYKAIFPRWKSVAAFVRAGKAMGHRLDQCRVGELLRFRASPRSKATGELTTTAIAIAGFLGRQPEELFPDELYAQINGADAAIDLDSKLVLPNSEQILRRLPAPPEDAPDADMQGRAEKLDGVLSTLPYRVREVVRLRYGIPDGVTFTYAEIGHILKVSVERARQMEAKGVRMLQHPKRARQLEAFFEGRRPISEAESVPA